MRLKWAIAVAGTHGKTTTTSHDRGRCSMPPASTRPWSMAASSTPTAPMPALGQGDWMVVEADESDGTFLRLPATIAVVTNIDPEHMEHYGSFDAVRDAFQRLRRERAVLRLRRAVHRPSRGAGAARAGSPTAAWSPTASARRPTCARSAADRPWRRRRVRRRRRDRRAAGRPPEQRLRLSMPGRHNVAECPGRDRRRPRARDRRRGACGTRWPASAGVKRRFTRTGTVGGVTHHRRLRPPSGRDPRRAATARAGPRAG